MPGCDVCDHHARRHGQGQGRRRDRYAAVLALSSESVTSGAIRAERGSRAASRRVQAYLTLAVASALVLPFLARPLAPTIGLSPTGLTLSVLIAVSVLNVEISR